MNKPEENPPQLDNDPDSKDKQRILNNTIKATLERHKKRAKDLKKQVKEKD